MDGRGLLTGSWPAARRPSLWASVLGITLLLPLSPASAGIKAVHWTQMAPATSPPARFGGTLAYDKAHQNAVLFGGVGTSSFNDTWLWNGTNWKQMHPATSPPARVYQFMAFDSTHHYVVLFGGYTTTWDNDTWTWDGTNGTQRFPATSPAPRSSYGGLSDDPAIGGVLLYGGYDQTNLYFDTWKWSGSNWIQIPTTGHPPGYIPALAWSNAEAGVLSFADGSNQTWVFDGTDWGLRFPTTSPPARYEAGLASVGQGDALFGGGYGGAFFADTWYENGTTWSKLPGSGPSARGYVGMTFDAKRGKVVLFGGLDSNYVNQGDTWTLGA
jgi:hypothetical protein